MIKLLSQLLLEKAEKFQVHKYFSVPSKKNIPNKPSFNWFFLRLYLICEYAALYFLKALLAVLEKDDCHPQDADQQKSSAAVLVCEASWTWFSTRSLSFCHVFAGCV